jgi:hypothetical protein
MQQQQQYIDITHDLLYLSSPLLFFSLSMGSPRQMQTLFNGHIAQSIWISSTLFRAHLLRPNLKTLRWREESDNMLDSNIIHVQIAE